MRRPVIARKATTQMTRNKAGIIGQQVYLSCARCNAKRARLLLLARASASARQSGFATDCGIATNNSALGRFIYRRNERSEEHTSELQSLTNVVCRLLY